MSRSHYLTLAALTFATLALAAQSANAQIQLAYTNIDVPSAATGPKDNYAGGISSSGNYIVIDQSINSSTEQHGYLLSNGTYTPMDHPGTGPGVYTALIGVNSSGTVLGQYYNNAGTINEDYVETRSGSIVKIPQHSNSTATFINSIGDNGKVAGGWLDATSKIRVASLFNPATMEWEDTLPNVVPDKNTVANIIAPNGDVLVSYRDTNSERHWAIYSANAQSPPSSLPDPQLPQGATNLFYYGLNSSGLLLGEYMLDSRNHAFLFDGSMVTDADPPDALDLQLSYGLSESGQFVGYYTTAGDIPDKNGNRPAHSFLATPVPEPGTMALFVGMGVAGAGFLRRTRKRRAR